jgi:hypothetical protein
MIICNKEPHILPFVPISQKNLNEARKLLRTDTHSSDHAPACCSLTYSREKALEELQKCDAYISQLQSAILEAESHRDIFRSYIASCDSIRAPIRRLPNEVLRRIFIFSGETITINDDFLVSRRGVGGDLSLCMVCVQWRTLVQTIPELYNQLDVHIDSSYFGFQRFPSLLERLRLVLKMSRSLPLFVKFSYNEYGRDQGDALTPICAILFEHAKRIEELDLRMSWGVLSHAALSSLSGNLLSLKVLTLETAPHHDSQTPLNLFSETPCLQTLVLLSSVSFPLNLLPFPFTPRLTTAIVRRSSRRSSNNADVLGGFIQCLSSFPGLSSIVAGAFSKFEPSLPEPVSSNLSSLTIEVHPDMENLIQIMMSAKLPALKSLCLRRGTDFDDWELSFQERVRRRASPKPDFPVSTFSEFSSQSGFALRALELDGIRITHTTTLTLFRLLPDLVKLVVRGRGIWEFAKSVSQLLCCAHSEVSTSDVSLPKLEHICFHCGNSSFPGDAIVEMVKSRWYPSSIGCSENIVQCLRDVTVSFDSDSKGDFSAASLADLLALSKSGLRVDISDRRGSLL